MLDRLTEVLRLVGTGHGDIGILTATNRQANDVMEALGRAGVATVSLQQYAGRSSDGGRVGTVKRAKGLEFKQVLLAHVDPRLLDAAPAEPSETKRERRERGRRELYVGMTRARDGLWVGVRSGATRGR